MTKKRYILCCQLLILSDDNFHLTILYMTFDRVCCLPFKNSYLGQCSGFVFDTCTPTSERNSQEKTENFNVEGSRQHISPSMGEGDEGYKGSQ